MARSNLTEHPDGIYRPLESQIEERMNPPLPARDKCFWLRTFGVFAATILAGLGVLIGMLIICGFAGVFFVIGKIRRGWK